MKIICESCSARYTVDDQKLAGRTLKIGCKRCGNAIVVGGAPIDRQRAAPAKTEWFVMIAGEAQGPVGVDRIATLIEDGVIEWETYVWTEGLEGWCALREVWKTERGMGPTSAPPASEDPPTMRHARRAAAKVGRETPAAAMSLRDVVMSQDATAQRDENSVLFSLSNLKSLSAMRTSTPSKALEAKPARARTDPSGSIDLGRLATTAAPVSKLSRADDLLAFGGPSLGLTMLGPPLIPPAETTPAKTSSGLGFGLGVTTAICAVAVAALALLPQSETRAIAEQTRRLVAELTRSASPRTDERSASEDTFAAAEPASLAAASPISTTAEGAFSPADLVDAPRELAPASVQLAAPSERTTAAESERAPGAARSERAHRDRRSGAPAENAQAPAAEPSAAEDLDSSDVDALIARAVGDPPAREEAAVADARPPTPSRSDIVSAMDGVSGPVRACGQGAHGVVPVRIVFAGDSGRTRNAEVQATTMAPEVRSCVARAVRAAHVPRFRQDTFSVTYPFRL